MDGGKKKNGNSNVVKYNKWGYIFLAPFIIVYGVFQLIPFVSTIYYSFFENYRSGLKQIGPNFIGMGNYAELLSNADIWKYTENTFVMWVIGFVPQIVVSLLLAAWFSDPSLRLKGQRFFKTVIYLPNLIMAAAFSMLKFMSNTWSARTLVGFMNFLMWFGNTTILLLAGMMGIDTSLFEAAEVDGATAGQIFWKVTMPLLRPIFIFVLITSLIGGLQMFDVPQILTAGEGAPDRTTMTLIMFLNKHLYNKNYGMSGALSVILLIITGILSFAVFKFTTDQGHN